LIDGRRQISFESQLISFPEFSRCLSRNAGRMRSIDSELQSRGNIREDVAYGRWGKQIQKYKGHQSYERQNQRIGNKCLSFFTRDVKHFETPNSVVLVRVVT